MIEAVKFWNEPNNKAHWDFDLDPGWNIYAEMVKKAALAVKTENVNITRVLGGISPIDQQFISHMKALGVLNNLNAVAIHGFPLDWNHWPIDDWPTRLKEIRAVTDLPVWITEVGVSTFGAEEVQEFGLKRTAELLLGTVDRIHWYTLFDLPNQWEAIAYNKKAEGSSYYRHYYMGLLHEDGSPKPAAAHFHNYTPEIGICQWFRFEDERLESAVHWLNQLGVKRLRTGLSWEQFYFPNSLKWFDKMMSALEDFELTITFCFTPPGKGINPHHSSPPLCVDDYADFCAAMIKRYT
jgi:beta-xylosidase